MKAGWNEVQLGELFEITSSKRVMQSDWRQSGVPFYRAREVVRLASEGKVENELFVSEEQFQAFEKKFGVPKPGDIMVTGVGTLGRCYVVQPGDRFYFKDASVLWFRSRNLVDSKFVEYAFQTQSVTEQINAGVGATVGTYTISRADQTRIPLPPPDEQKRIVAVLDEALQGLSRARDNAEANLVDAQKLFETSLSVFLDRNSIDWTATTLGAAYDVRDGTHDSPKYQPTGRPLITSKNLGRDGLHFEKVSFISEQDFEAIKKRSEVHRGDVLFAMIGTIGNPIVVDVDPDFAIKNVALFKMKGGRSGRFLRFVLRSKTVVEKMKAEAKGTTQQFVGLGYLRSFPLFLPPPESEPGLVELLAELEAGCRKAESVIDRKILELDTLRQALLQKAFSGELT